MAPKKQPCSSKEVRPKSFTNQAYQSQELQPNLLTNPANLSQQLVDNLNDLTSCQSLLQYGNDTRNDRHNPDNKAATAFNANKGLSAQQDSPIDAFFLSSPSDGFTHFPALLNADDPASATVDENLLQQLASAAMNSGEDKKPNKKNRSPLKEEGPFDMYDLEGQATTEPVPLTQVVPERRPSDSSSESDDSDDYDPLRSWHPEPRNPLLRNRPQELSYSECEDSREEHGYFSNHTPGMRKIEDVFEEMDYSGFAGLKAEFHEINNRDNTMAEQLYTRIQVRRENGELRFIDASYVDGFNHKKAYICLGGPPQKSYVDDFWLMVWQQNSRVIVMLAEDNWPYFPKKSDDVRHHQNLRVTFMSESEANYIYRTTLQVENVKTREKRVIYHLQLTKWAGTSIPANVKRFLQLLGAVHYYRKLSMKKMGLNPQDQSAGPPIVVHGTGAHSRAGMYVLIDVAIDMVNAVRRVNFPELLWLLKQQSIYAPATPEQYDFSHHVVLNHSVSMKFLPKEKESCKYVR